jgi:hypothetical protein
MFPRVADPDREESPSHAPTDMAADETPAETAAQGPGEEIEGISSPEVVDHADAPLAPDATTPPVSEQEEWTDGGGEESLPERLLKPLEMRISRLEEGFAHLQDANQKTSALAAKAVDVPMARLAPPTPTPPNIAAPAAALLVAGAQLLASNAASGQAGAPPPGPANRSLWLLFDIVAEGRAILRMFVDPRYKMSWLGRIVPLVLLVVYFTWRLWFPFANLLKLPPVSNVIDLVIAFLLFKILSHEARRYRQTAPDLPSSLKL